MEAVIVHLKCHNYDRSRNKDCIVCKRSICTVAILAQALYSMSTPIGMLRKEGHIYYVSYSGYVFSDFKLWPIREKLISLYAKFALVEDSIKEKMAKELDALTAFEKYDSAAYLAEEVKKYYEAELEQNADRRIEVYRLVSEATTYIRGKINTIAYSAMHIGSIVGVADSEIAKEQLRRFNNLYSENLHWIEARITEDRLLQMIYGPPRNLIKTFGYFVESTLAEKH